MAQTKLEIQLRCNSCDSVLIVSNIHVDKDGCFAYVEPCEKCKTQLSYACDCDGENGLHTPDCNSWIANATR